jgi:hypothetical protein
MEALAGRNVCLAPWCNKQSCEKNVKDRSKEESLKAIENEEEWRTCSGHCFMGKIILISLSNIFTFFIFNSIFFSF